MLTSSPAPPPPPAAAPPTQPRSSYVSALALGLLSSSCCVIQLVLNAFSIGCAGFSVLTPLRPVFLGISFGLVLYTVFKYRLTARTIVTLFITLGLTITPEMVAVVNQSNGSFSISSSGLYLPPTLSFVVQFMPSFSMVDRTQSLARDGGSGSSCGAAPIALKQDASKPAPFTSSPKTGAPSGRIQYELDVQGMACEACASRLRQHFLRQAGVEHANVHFSKGKLYVWTSSQGMKFSERMLQDMVGAVDMKYRARLVQVYSEDNNNDE
ncbi:hypothetical protein BG004_004714 [Podila humilis]|nr:hypothetical protein BG004_004714 [Podila humilis]